MAFTVSCLKHTAGEVRDVGRRLIVWLYQRGDKRRVRSALPPDTSKIRQKNQLYKMIFEEFDRIDGKRSVTAKQTRFQSDSEAQQIAQLRKQNVELQKMLQNKQASTVGGQPKASKLVAPRSYRLNKKSNSLDGNETQSMHGGLTEAPYASFMTEKSLLRLRAASNLDEAPMPDPMDDRQVFKNNPKIYFIARVKKIRLTYLFAIFKQ